MIKNYLRQVNLYRCNSRVGTAKPGTSTSAGWCLLRGWVSGSVVLLASHPSLGTGKINFPEDYLMVFL